MLGLPTTEWTADPPCADDIERAAPAPGDWQSVGEIQHVFTHFNLTLQVWRLEVAGRLDKAVWTPISDLGGLPSVFLKVAVLGLNRII